MEQQMAGLPPDRLSTEAPFTHVGLDVFGPWNVCTRRTRGGQANSKRWAVMFTCLSVRAVHIELIESMDSSSFINALRRFISLRGPVKQIRSDCGTNFRGACKELRMLLDDKTKPNVLRYLSKEGCAWIFNPPHSSHMGGAWERMIGISRRILDSMLSQTSSSCLTHEVLSTLMAEVCAIINARPIAPISSDPESPFLLTPAMILTQKTSSSYPPPGTFGTSDLYHKQWKRGHIRPPPTTRRSIASPLHQVSSSFDQALLPWTSLSVSAPLSVSQINHSNFPNNLEGLDRYTQQLSQVTDTLNTLCLHVTISAASPEPPPPPQPPAAPAICESYVPPLEPFLGNLGKCRGFLLQCCLVFAQQPHTYASDPGKVAYVIGLLRGRALEWAEVKVGSSLLIPFHMFINDLRKAFDHPACSENAAHRLLSLRQGFLDVADFSVQFRVLATEARWDNAALWAVFTMPHFPWVQLFSASGGTPGAYGAGSCSPVPHRASTPVSSCSIPQLPLSSRGHLPHTGHVSHSPAYHDLAPVFNKEPCHSLPTAHVTMLSISSLESHYPQVTFTQKGRPWRNT
ncbi:hypothetical protein Q8A73_012532 [Channa argus]|nr:hypothetical protein Q8A73_012532 [Channa argus]